MDKLEGEDKKNNKIVFILSPLMLQLTFLLTNTNTETFCQLRLLTTIKVVDNN